MSYSSYEKAIRALVEGGLRMINNMIPEPPTPRQIRQTIQPSRPAVPAGPTGPAVQPRLHVPPDRTTGRFQKQLPVPREVPAEQIPSRAGYPQVDVPRETLPARIPGVAPGQRSLPVGQNIPASTTVRPYGILSSPQAPEPAFAYGKELMRRDPEGYRRIRSIVETTAAERGVNADDVMEALLSKEGFDSPLIRQLEAAPIQSATQGGGITPYAGGGMTPPGASAGLASRGPGGALARTGGSALEPGIQPVNVYEIVGRGAALPEGSPIPTRANAMAGVNTVDLGQFLSSPVAASVAAGGTAAGQRIPVAPFVGGGVLGGLGLAAYMSGRQGQPQEPVYEEPLGIALRNAGVDMSRLGIKPPVPGETQLGAPTATPEGGANTPSVTGAPVTSASKPIAGSTNAIPGTVNPSSVGSLAGPIAPSPSAPVGGRAPAAPVGSSMGAGSVPQLMDSRDSEYRQAIQNAAQGLRQDASQYQNIGDFYRVQSAYANAPGRAEQIIGALKSAGAPASVGIESEADFETWARKNPELAYRLQLQMQRRGPSQQMPNAQGAVLGTSMGTNTPNNAAGQARAAAMNAAFGTQGAADLNATLAPQAYQTLEKMPLF